MKGYITRDRAESGVVVVWTGVPAEAMVDDYHYRPIGRTEPALLLDPKTFAKLFPDIHLEPGEGPYEVELFIKIKSRDSHKTRLFPARRSAHTS